MTHECSTGCGREVRDAFVCWQCGQRLREALESLLDRPHPVWPDEVLPGLLANLDETLAQQVALERSSAMQDPEPYDREATAGASRRPIPLDLRASDAKTHLRGILVGWVRVLLEDSVGHPTRGHTSHADGLTPPSVGDRTLADTPTSLVAFLLACLDRLRCHEAGGEAVDEILDAIARVHRIVDRAEDRWYAGQCRCRVDLYAKLYASVIECRECGAAYDVPARRAELLASVENVLAPATEIARALTTLDTPVSRSSIAGYAHRGRLVEKGRDRRDRPLYRVGDVRALIGERARAS